jgi:hypothetical protein
MIEQKAKVGSNALFLAALFYFLLLPFRPVSRATYFSENALLADYVRTIFISIGGKPLRRRSS